MRRHLVRFWSESFRVIPELPYLPREERNEIIRLCSRRMLSYWYFIPAGLLVLLCAWVGMGLARLLADYFTSSSRVLSIAGVVGAVLFIGLGLAWVGSRVERRLYHHFMAELRERKLCTKCGYNLHTTPDRCPECGNLSGAIKIPVGQGRGQPNQHCRGQPQPLQYRRKQPPAYGS